MRRWTCGILSGLILWLGIGLPVCAQGLLGTYHIDSQFSTLFRNDSAGDIDPAILGFVTNLNAPLVRGENRMFGVDLYGRISGSYLDGSMGSDQFKVDGYSYSLGTNLYLNQWEGVRPWIGLGYMLGNVRQEQTSGGATSVTTDSIDVLRLSLGAESVLTERIALRTSFEFLFQDKTFSEFKDPRFLTEFVIRPADHWYFRLGGSIDFDGNVGVLAGGGYRF